MKKQMGKIIKYCLYPVVFFVCLGLLWGLLMLSNLIPNSKIEDKLMDSSLYYMENDAFADLGKDKMYNVEDNYADAILLNIIWNMDSDTVLKSSLDTKYYDGEEYGVNYGLFAALNGVDANMDYSRYWHGSASIVRTMLTFINVQQIKMTIAVVIWLLIGVNCLLLVKKNQYFAAISLIISMLSVHIWNIRLALEYEWAFLVCFMLLPFFILLEKKGDRVLGSLFIISGVMTAFFDFLTVETIPFFIPAIIILIMQIQENRLKDYKETIKWGIRHFVTWAMAYGMTFVMKWSLASIVAGENKFISALTSVEERLVGVGDLENSSLIKRMVYAVLANLSTLFGGTHRIEMPRIFLGTMAIFVILGSIFYLFRKTKLNKDIAIIMAILAFVPFVRFIVLSNHSYLHEFFTYRVLSISILSMITLLWYNIEVPIKKRRRLR